MRLLCRSFMHTYMYSFIHTFNHSTKRIETFCTEGQISRMILKQLFCYQFHFPRYCVWLVELQPQSLFIKVLLPSGIRRNWIPLRNWVSKLCRVSQSICCASFHGWNDQNVRGCVVHKEYQIRIFFRCPLTLFLKDWTERWIGRLGQVSAPHGIPGCIASGQLTFGMLQYTQFSACIAFTSTF